MGVYERRTCAKRGCSREFIPKSVRQKYCKVHKWRRPKDPAHSMKYGAAHRRLRAQWAARMLAGVPVSCARCRARILPGQSWDLGHVDGGGPRDYSGPEHSRCNRQTASGGVGRIW
jgi:hypothetical protein